MQTLITLLSSALFAIAAFGDVRCRRIPNLLVLAIAVLGIGRLLVTSNLADAAATALTAGAVFLVGFLLFLRGLWGGGDAKLLAATVLLVGHRALGDFLLAMSLIGLAVTLATLTNFRLKRHASEAALSVVAPARPTVPYGVAIAAAGMLTLFLQFSSQG